MTDARDVGDWRIPTISITNDAGLPASGTVTCAVEDPDGLISAVAMTAGTPTATATPWSGAAYELTKAGSWIERFTIVGDGKGKARQTVWVQADPGAAPSGERVYATTGDYANAIHEPPADDIDLRRVLAAATREIEDVLLSAVYDTDDTTLLPTDSAVTEAIRDAVIEQAHWQIEQGDPYGLGAGTFQTVSIGGVSLGRGSGGGAADAPGRRSPRAQALLRAAGLLGGTPYTVASWGLW
jgi:hypothetical protein